MEDLRKKYPYFFLVIISIIILFLYVAFQLLLPLQLQPWQQVPTIIFIVVSNIVFILLVWSIVMAISKDPGKVPLQWGFNMQSQARKYCLICHVFKPQRTHHCSTCGRCVLNMDHHCPWIHTCIGFHNRKAFILMLIYTTLSTFINIIAFIFSITKMIGNLQNQENKQIILTLIICFAFVLNTIIFFTIAIFLKFHLELIFSNLTTLETLELKRQGRNPEDEKSTYDMGNYFNWVQVFGRNSWTWWIPIFVWNEGPSGDGVIWPKRSTAGK